MYRGKVSNDALNGIGHTNEIMSMPIGRLVLSRHLHYLPNTLVTLHRLWNQFVCVSVSESVRLSHKRSWTLDRSQSSTDLHQTCHHGRVPGGVINYCFRWKCEILMSLIPEVQLIFITAFMENTVNV